MVESPPDIQAPGFAGRLALHAERIVRHWRSSYWVSSGAFTMLTRLSTLGLGFVNFLILIRMLPAVDYGAWVLFISISTLMELVKHGFIRNPLIRYFAITPAEEQPALQTASMVLNMVIAGVQAVVLLAFAYTLPAFWGVPQLHNLFLIYIVTTLAFIPAIHFETVQQAGMQFIQLFFVNLIKQGGLFVYILFSFVAGTHISLEGLAIAHLSGLLASSALSFICSRSLVHFAPRLSATWIRELYHYGKFTFGTNVSSMITKNMSSWMLGRMISVNAVTLFNPALRISNLVEVPNDTLATIYFPRLSRDVAEEGVKAVKRRYEMAVGALLAMVIPGVTLIIVFAPQIVMLVAGPGFSDTVPILRLTMLYCLLLPFNRLFGVTLDAIGKAKVNFRMVMLTAIVNLGVCLIFIRVFGTIGAAIGTLVTYSLMFAANQIYLRRHFGITIGGVFRGMIMFYRDLPGRLKGV